MAPVHAQSPSLNLPSPPSQPVTVIFKDITRNDLFRLMTEAIKQSKRVEHFVMAKGQRGYIEYKGELMGDSESFVEILKEAAGDKLKVETRPKTAGLEILVTPQSP